MYITKRHTLYSIMITELVFRRLFISSQNQQYMSLILFLNQKVQLNWALALFTHCRRKAGHTIQSKYYNDTQVLQKPTDNVFNLSFNSCHCL